MLNTIYILNFILPLFYIISLLFYCFDFIRVDSPVKNSKRLFLLATLLVHLIYILLRNFEFGHFLYTNKFELFSLLSFSISLSYFFLELLTDIRGTGVFIIVFSLIFQTISSFFIQDIYIVKEVLQNPLLGFHVTAAIIGHSSVTISAVYGILFLILYYKLKTHRYGIFFQRLPNLEVLESLSFKSILIGYCFFTISIFIGTILLPKSFPNFNFFDPKLIATFIIWILYTIGITLKLIFKLYGKKVILFALAGFIFVLISMITTLTYSKSFHNF